MSQLIEVFIAGTIVGSTIAAFIGVSFLIRAKVNNRGQLTYTFTFTNSIKIEDFHIGFEYEELIHDPERYLNQGMIWVQKTYGFNSPRLHKIERLIKQNKIRRVV